jgi:putative transposase
MPKGLKRIYGQGHLHFITFRCYRRLPLLRSARARNVFVRVLDEVRKEHGFKLVGSVVMPEHVHLLITRERLPQFRQKRFYDFNVWSPRKESREARLRVRQPSEAGVGQ